MDALEGTLGEPSVPLESEETELSRTRYQQGSIRRVKRRKGQDVWVFRWLDTKADGSRKENNRVIGSVLEYRTKAAAMKAAEALRININSTTPRQSVFGMTFGELADHYMAKELEVNQEEARKPKAYSTVEANRRYLRKWIVPRWGKVPVSEMEPIVIEDWLGRLTRAPHKLANGTLVKLRSIMNAVFRHGMRHGFLPRDAEANPIKYVRQSGGSTKEHTRLTPEQAMSIVGHLHEPVRTMVLLDASTGLRASELTALRWQDADFDAGILHIRRGIVYGVVGEVKTDASRSQLPLVPLLAEFLLSWRKETPYAKPSDWIFASPRMKGKKPYRGNSLVRNQLRIAKEKAGIPGPVGWHSFRRSISTWLIENEENVKVTQELLRHAGSGTTLDLYAKAVTPSKRRAQEKIVHQLLAAQQSVSDPADLLYAGAEK
jgi:integrase